MFSNKSRMPEGPSIVILKEEAKEFKGKKVLEVEGNLKAFDKSILKGKTIKDLKSWGKHFLIEFKDFSVRIHFLLFGKYRINSRSEAKPRLSLKFAKGRELNFYTSSIQLIEQPLGEVYDWTADVMNDDWDTKAALKKLRAHPDMLACDALLDQDIFAGVGNIIKNEVLFRIRVHPQSKVGEMPAAKLREMVKEARVYSFQFLEWKKKHELKKHWLAHTKKVCPRDHVAFKLKNLGKTHRRSFYCTKCQVLYT